MAHGQQLGQANGLWNSPDVPSSMNNSSHRGSNTNHSLLSNQFSNSIFNQLLQPSASQRAEAALQQQGFLTLVPNHRSLAAAVQQQLVAASLAAPNVHMLPTAHLQRASQHLLAHDFAGQSALLSREEREAILQRFPTSSIGYLPSASQTPLTYIRDQPMELDILAMNKAGGSKSGPDAASQLPCQARGMPADHNSSTAYFDIPSYASHGQHLLCSYQACRTAGVKFRYCLVCKKPVTKQNFRSRHLHADLTNPDDASSEKMQTSSTKKNRKCPAPQDSNEDDSTEPKICTEVGAPRDAKNAKTPEKTKEATEKEATKKKLGESPASSRRNDIPNLNLVSRRRRWATLLAERPSGFCNLNSWLATVFEVSDLGASWSATGTTLSDETVSTRSSVTQQSQWLALLQERPRNNDAAARTAWIVKVLQISCPEKAREESEASSILSTGSFPSVASNPAAEGDSTKLLVGATVPTEVAYTMNKEKGSPSYAANYDSGDVEDDDSKTIKRRKLGPAEEI